MASINTVLGPIDSEKLGFTQCHEHICGGFGGSPHSFPEFLDRPATLARAVKDLAQAKIEGLQTIMDVAPHDQGRDIRLQEEVSQQSGINIVVCTGTWLDVPRFFERLKPDKIAQMYIREIEEGIDGTGIKPGIIKVASDRDGVKPGEELVLRAAARASLHTGIPIMTHTWAPARIGDQQVQIFEEEGMDLSKVCIGHSNDTTNMEYLTGLLKKGVWLGMDRHPGNGPDVPDWKERTRVLKTLVDQGWAKRIMVAHDWDSSMGLFPSEMRAARETNNPDNYLFIIRNVIPYMRQLGVKDSDIDSITIDNPRRYLEGA